MQLLPRETEFSNWRFADKADGVWREASVPGHVHVDLLRHGVIEDPFFGENEKDCQWVDERDWSYRCAFDWQQDAERSHRILNFAGLDTICSVFLNGELIGEHDNMFVPLEIDVSDLLRQGANEIRVDFQSAARVGRERKARYLAEQGLADDVPNFDERAFVRKAQCMFGWDWGPRLVSCGIWKPALLIECASAQDAQDQSDQPNPSDFQLVQTPDADGATFEFLVNGKPFYALGANWIPDHAFPSQISKERYRERLQQANDMGINMLRIWGGGIYEDDSFYDACDELGILVWQDFMFACSYYPDTPEYQEAIKREAEHQVRRLRRHPCIAIWCGNNECHQVWQDRWGGKDKQPPRFHGEVLYHEILKEVVERLDPGRAYWPGSPFGSGYCNSGKDGDQHFWDVWHGRGDWTFYKESDARFCSEFGFASSPSKATWADVGVSMEVEPEHATARAHNKTGKPFETFQGLVEIHYPKAKTLEEWSYFSQLNQRDAMRAAIEHYRFSGRCRGALLWQLNDCWPVESWSVLEFGGRKKAVAHELPRLFAPLLIRIERKDDEIVLSGCLQNSEKPRSGFAVLEGFDLQTGDRLTVTSGDVSVVSEEIKQLLRIKSPVGQAIVWRAQFANIHASFCEGKPTGICEVRPKVTPAEGGFVLSAVDPMLDVILEDTENAANLFEPNFFNLLPRERIQVKTRQPVTNLRVRCLDYR